MAMARGMVRGRRTSPPAAAISDRFTSGSPNRAAVEATRKSQVSAISVSSGQGRAVDRRDQRFGPLTQHDPAEAAPLGGQLPESALGHCLQVGAGAEHRSGVGEDAEPQGVVGLQAVDGGFEPSGDFAVDRVASLGAVHGYEGHVALGLIVDHSEWSLPLAVDVGGGGGGGGRRLARPGARGSTPKRAAICGTRSDSLPMAASSSSVGFSGMPAGITCVRTGERATESTTVAQRRWLAVGLRSATAMLASRSAMSGGSGDPALGGRELRRSARTVRPSWIVSASSSSHFRWSTSRRWTSPARRLSARGASLVAAGRPVGGRDHGSDVAQVDRGDPGEGSVGSIVPLRCPSRRERAARPAPVSART